jgi:hypothetical protein
MRWLGVSAVKRSSLSWSCVRDRARKEGWGFSVGLVDLLLLVQADLARTHIYEEEKTAAAVLLALLARRFCRQSLHNRQDLEEIVLGKVLVWMVRMKLRMFC